MNSVNSATTNIKNAKSYKYLVENLTRNAEPENMTMMQLQSEID